MPVDSPRGDSICKHHSVQYSIIRFYYIMEKDNNNIDRTYSMEYIANCSCGLFARFLVLPHLLLAKRVTVEELP
jgi:hypothetical protein